MTEKQRETERDRKAHLRKMSFTRPRPAPSLGRGCVVDARLPAAGCRAASSFCALCWLSLSVISATGETSAFPPPPPPPPFSSLSLVLARSLALALDLNLSPSLSLSLSLSVSVCLCPFVGRLSLISCLFLCLCLCLCLYPCLPLCLSVSLSLHPHQHRKRH